MSWPNLQAIHRFGPEAHTQALDELGSFSVKTPTVLAGLPEVVGRKNARHERARTQLAGTHRLRQAERAQTFAEKPGQMSYIRRRRGEPEYATGRRSMPMSQQTFELRDAVLTRLQEFPEIRQ